MTATAANRQKECISVHRKGMQQIEKAWGSKALLSSVLESFDGLIYVSSDRYRIEYINERLIKRRGYNIERERCYKALHGRETPCPFCVKTQVMEGENVSFEVKDPRDQRWYLSVNTPVFRNRLAMSHLSMITDIHDRKVSEMRLRENAQKLQTENLLLRSSIKQRHKFGAIVGKSVPMQAIYEQIITAAASDATVIIYGEPGTGKELVAAAIHDISERRTNRFVPAHCAAIPANLFESEFFGHKAGAFSGAISSKYGYFEYANGGSLFLDEIGEISKNLQTKLLRVIEGGGYTPLGEAQVKHSDFRIIAATNRNLLDLVDKGRMRADFYYRIHVIPIHLPPLRERKEDLELLINHFMHLHGTKRNIRPIPGEMIEKMNEYHWPGNVRELQNVIIRYCAVDELKLGENMTDIRLLTSPIPAGSALKPGIALQQQINAYEKQILSEALAFNRWHRGKTAKFLGIDRKTLFNKMRRHGILH